MSSPEVTMPPTAPKFAALRLPMTLLHNRAVRATLGAYALTRAAVLFIIFVSSVQIPMQQGQFLYADAGNVVLDGLIRFDSWWYSDIATHGYRLGSPQAGDPGNIAFFPVYPLLVRLGALVTGNVFVAGVLISNIALLVALGYLYALCRELWDDDTAGRAVLYLAAAPTAVFFSAMYTESLFLALVCACMYYSVRGQWWPAVATGIVAAATRNTGFVLAAVVAMEGVQRQSVRLVPTSARASERVGRWAAAAVRSWRTVLVAALVPIGLVAYMTYLNSSFGDPLGFVHSVANWGRDVSGSGPLSLASHAMTRLHLGSHPLAGQISARTLLDILFTVIAAGLIAAVAAKLRPSFAVYCVLTFLAPLFTGTVSSMTRYVLMLVPCFMLLAVWGRRQWVDRLVLGVSLPLLGYFTILFSHWYFAG
ncbi:MAG: glycosyltransferase family 39 protein [Herpetosiphon sp.]